MSILILSTVRSGSSRLLQAISKAYNQEGIFEPTTPDYKQDFDPKKDIVKIVVQTLPTSKHIELIEEFSKTIILDRKDIVAQSESYLNLWNKFPGRHDMKYTNANFTEEQIEEIVKKFLSWKQKLSDISEQVNIPITYLEDLLEHKDIGVEYDKELFTEKYKLRQVKKPLI